MEIEFNTSRIAKRDSSQPVAKREATPSVSDTTSFTAAASLEAKLSDAYAVRPEMVEKAKSLLAIPNYPPTELLDRIAALLAVHNKH
jgi:hypothetical protein